MVQNNSRKSTQLNTDNNIQREYYCSEFVTPTSILFAIVDTGNNKGVTLIVGVCHEL